eukprot:CAMPEP_0115699934 /NCGR_PEP_ID=MMETSP0272-20121206/67143_1 /TAXON_ID=71861 /ORGANISM="Scrippsiella trochoidea, Strain CCMP3099" /LENGTH=31 /DNA_ID= /DNA_START= /DNA_END= /DNA_ORIENTATION=
MANAADVPGLWSPLSLGAASCTLPDNKVGAS